MKETRIKVSVSQDGLLPQETADVASVQFPNLPKKLLKALGFERVDSSTFVGVLPVFVNLGDKEQQIEIELGVSLPEMRKKVMEILKGPSGQKIEEVKTIKKVQDSKKEPKKRGRKPSVKKAKEK